MPVLDGLAATRALQAVPHAPAVIVVTTFDQDDYVLDAIAAGARGFLLKRCSGADLVAAVRAVADGDSILSPEVTRAVLARVRAGGPQRASDLTPYGLSPRESDVLALIGLGLNNTEIAGRLHLSTSTVKTHVGNVLAKTDSRDRVQAALLASRAGLMPPLTYSRGSRRTCLVRGTTGGTARPYAGRMPGPHSRTPTSPVGDRRGARAWSSDAGFGPPWAGRGPWGPGRAPQVALAAVLAVVQVVGSLGAPRAQPDRRPLDLLALVLLLTGPVALALMTRTRVPVVTVTVGVATAAYLVLGYPYGPVVLSLVVALVAAVLTGHRLVAVARRRWRPGRPRCRRRPSTPTAAGRGPPPRRPWPGRCSCSPSPRWAGCAASARSPTDGCWPSSGVAGPARTGSGSPRSCTTSSPTTCR